MSVEDDDLAARMRAADPAAGLPPAHPARVARLLEDTMEPTPTAPARRPPWAWLAAVAAVVVVATVGVALVARDGDPPAPPVAEPSVTTLGVAEAAPARCMVLTAELLAGQELAFDGTVTGIEDRVATLEPTTWYAGTRTDLVEVSLPPDDLSMLIGVVQPEVGQRYLVAATDGWLAPCGMSGPYDPDLEELYVEAFTR